MNWITRPAEVLWGLWSWAAFILACLIALVVVIFVPGQERRQRIVSWTSRLPFVLSGVAVEVRGRENIPESSAIAVANHASYLDGILLNGFLPPQFGFVIKGEMRNIPVVHFLLRRSGSKFVERKDRSGSARDARQIVRAAQDGESLGIFPEGTFRLEPGVGRFRAGAFLAAIKGELPVLPIAIQGTRRMLPSKALLPRPSRLVVEIGPAIQPDEDVYAGSQTLAEAARQRILGMLGEPDLMGTESRIDKPCGEESQRRETQ